MYNELVCNIINEYVTFFVKRIVQSVIVNTLYKCGLLL